MISRSNLILTVLSTIAVGTLFIHPRSDEVEETNLQLKNPTNFQTLYSSLIDGYDVSYSGSFKQCYNPLTQLYSGSIISSFQYYNDTRMGKERIEYSYTNLARNTTSIDYYWSYFRESMYPNETINIYTSDFTYFYQQERNGKLTECSFDQVEMKRLQYVKPLELKTFEKVRDTLLAGKVIRIRNTMKRCESTGSFGTQSPDIVQGGIIQSFKLFAEANGIPEYLSFSVNANFQNVNSTAPQMLTDLNEVRLYKNGSAIFNVYIFDSNNERNVYTQWLKCPLHSALFVYTDDRGSKIPFF